MALNKENDGLFHWNFNLADSDSDFTDIDYAEQKAAPAAEIREAAETEPEPEPIIFVKGDYKPKDAGDFVGRYVESTVSAAPVKAQAEKLRRDSEKLDVAIALAGNRQKKEAAAPKKDAAMKPAGKTVKDTKKQYIAKKKSIRWQPIAFIAAVVLIIALLVILFWPDGGGKDPAASGSSGEANSQWTVAPADSEVAKLMDDYFDAKIKTDAGAMRLVLVPEALVVFNTMSLESQIYKDYVNREIQICPGLSKGEYVICATYDTELNQMEGSVPTVNWFYAKKDGNGKLRLMTTSEMAKEENSAIKAYAEKSSQGLADYVQRLSERYTAVMEANPRIAEYMTNISNGEYFVVPPEESSAATEPGNDPSAPDNPEQPSWTAPHGTEEDTSRTFCAYINGDSVRLRGTPSLEQDNIIGIFDKGYYVHVIGVLEDWYHVSDVMSKNDATGAAQSPGGKSGYIYKDFISLDYSDLN